MNECCHIDDRRIILDAERWGGFPDGVEGRVDHNSVAPARTGFGLRFAKTGFLLFFPP